HGVRLAVDLRDPLCHRLHLTDLFADRLVAHLADSLDTLAVSGLADGSHGCFADRLAHSVADSSVMRFLNRPADDFAHLTHLRLADRPADLEVLRLVGDLANRAADGVAALAEAGLLHLPTYGVRDVAITGLGDRLADGFAPRFHVRFADRLADRVR